VAEKLAKSRTKVKRTELFTQKWKMCTLTLTTPITSWITDEETDGEASSAAEEETKHKQARTQVGVAWQESL
jgi:hypothetical protein